ncbi:anaerobic selenocysteine-containing dehydrogenase [Paraburkholderia atlantica]
MDHHARTQNERLDIKTTACYMCACRCGIRVHLRDGEVRYIDGNPEHPLNQGVICAKGASGIMKQYSPAHLVAVARMPVPAGVSRLRVPEWRRALARLAVVTRARLARRAR